MYIQTETKNPKNLNSKFMDLTPGQHLVRILSSPQEVLVFHTHYINGASVKCLGENCPQCELNKSIIQQYPDFRKVKGFSPRTFRFALNVFDKSPAKVCPECGKEVKKASGLYPFVCPKCGGTLQGIPEAPLNKIKILAGGSRLADQLNALSVNYTDENGNPIGLTQFDISLIVQGTGQERTITVLPAAKIGEMPSYAKEDLHDLTKVPLTLTEQEMVFLIRGTPLREILAARSGSTAAVETKPESQEYIQADVQKIIRDLFGD